MQIYICWGQIPACIHICIQRGMHRHTYVYRITGKIRNIMLHHLSAFFILNMYQEYLSKKYLFETAIEATCQKLFRKPV